MIACPRCGHPNAADARYCSNCALALTPAGAPGEARKTVTIMFMDAVGSTSIGERTDPETLRRVMARYFEEIRVIVELHGGVVEKYIGDAVMAVFGVPAVHEDDALRAVRAAADIRRRLDDLGQELRTERGLAVEWRTGINTGEVFAGDIGTGQRLLTGDAVNVAARLEQAAGQGEILVGAKTRRLLRDAVTVDATPPIVAKGKSEPLEAFRLISVQPGLGQPARQFEAPMVGRRRPRHQLADAYDQAVGERICHLFTVLGAAGVGKSRLVREFLAELGDEALVLRGRCLSYGEGITYWPIAEMVRQAARLTEDDSDEQALAKISRLLASEADAPKAARRLGELIGRFAGVAGQEEMFWAVRSLFESLARARPLVVVVDDLHWAEPTLLDLIEHLADWTSDAPVLLICIARQDLLEMRPNWGGGKAYATTLTLEPLNDDESRELISGLLGRVDLGPAFGERIAGAAEGNPLFVEELIGMLIDSGRLVPRDGGWTIAGEIEQIDVPPTIHALLSARLDGLPGAERMVLERASVEGKTFHRGAVVELTPDPIRDTVPLQLRSLARKELVRHDQPDFAGEEAFRFRHLLIRDAAYAAVPKETRAELHVRFARWLGRVAADRLIEYEELLGYHYEQAVRYRTELGLTDPETARLARSAAEHLAAAGERAFDRSDIAAARKLLGSATALLPDDDPISRRLRAELADTVAKSGDLHAADAMLVATIEAAKGAGDILGQAYAEIVRVDLLGSLGRVPIEQIIGQCERLLAVFEHHDDRRGVDRATYELARHHFFAGHTKVAEEGLLRAMAGAPSPASAARFAAWLPALLVWGPTPVVEAEPRTRELLSGAASRNVEAMCNAALGMMRAFVGEFDEAREHVRRAIDIRRELGMVVATLAHEGNFLGLVETLAGEYGAAELIMTHSFTGLTEAGEHGYASTVAGHLANLYVIIGRFAEAERYATLAEEMSSPDDIDARVRSLRSMARVAASRGDAEQALDLARQAAAMVDVTDYLDLRGETYVDLAEVMLSAGDTAGAREAFETARTTFLAKGVSVEAANVARRLAEIA